MSIDIVNNKSKDPIIHGAYKSRSNLFIYLYYLHQSLSHRCVHVCANSSVLAEKTSVHIIALEATAASSDSTLAPMMFYLL